jgi:hypothetical protein
MPLSIVAATFQITQAWLSCIIHSDAFQSKLKERQDLVFHHSILPITDKMQAVAHAALDRLVERIPHEDEPKNLSGIAADVLDRLGYGAPSKGATILNFNQQNNQHIHTSTLREEIVAAQALLGRAPAVQELAHNGERAVLALPATDLGTLQEVPAEGDSGLGKSDALAALFSSLPPVARVEAGSEIREESPLAAGGTV